MQALINETIFGGFQTLNGEKVSSFFCDTLSRNSGVWWHEKKDGFTCWFLAPNWGWVDSNFD